MSTSEFRQIQDVLDIQSHTHFLHRVDTDHRSVLFSRSYHDILFDFVRSRRALSQSDPYILYLPYLLGGHNATAAQVASDAGFHMAATAVREKVKPGDSSFLLKRLYILRAGPLETISRPISSQPQG